MATEMSEIKSDEGYPLTIEQMNIINSTIDVSSGNEDDGFDKEYNLKYVVNYEPITAIDKIKNWGKVPDQSFQQEADWSLGASFRWYFIGIDYTYVYNELTPVQYLSIIGRF